LAKPSILGPGKEAVRSLHQAAEDGDVETVRARLHATPHLALSTEVYNLTPLHRAAGHGHTEIAALLVATGADVNAKDYGGATPLHAAASAGHAGVAELLLRNKSKVNARDADDFTPLHRAARQGHADVAAALLAHQADVNAKGDNIGAPLHEAASGGHQAVSELLLANGALANARSGASPTPWTPWHEAKRSGHPGLADLLRQHGGEDAAAGPISLQRAAEAGYLGRVQVLLKREPDEAAKPDFLYRRTALHWAALKDRLAIAEQLLAHGVAVDSKDKRGKTALDYALDAAHGEVAALLRNRGGE
jgi:ankyrin repeat protein